jgi:hypothetical protein
VEVYVPIENPLGRLFEKYEDLIISDYNQMGNDMKFIFN